MDTKGLKIRLKISRNKMKTLQNGIKNYRGKFLDLVELIDEFLTEAEIIQLVDWEYFKNLDEFQKLMLFHKIKQEENKMNLLQNSNFIEGISSGILIELIVKLDDSMKIRLMNQPDFSEKYKLKSYQIETLIDSLQEENKQKILLNKKLILNNFGLKGQSIERIIIGFEKDETKLNLLDYYQKEIKNKLYVLNELSDESKKKILLEGQYELNNSQIVFLLESLSVKSFIDFFQKNKEFLQENRLKIYRVTEIYTKEKQLEFVSKLEQTELNQNEKRLVLATLNPKTKESIDTTKFSEEDVSALKKKTGIANRIEVDLNQNLEQYRGFDEILFTKSPIFMTEKERERFYQLCKICPNIEIRDELGIGKSTCEEYLFGEMWIQKLIEVIDDQWADLQKIAFVDFMIGQRISYDPCFETEVYDEEDVKALWKIISTGIRVCNGIAPVEKYILNKVGIQAEAMHGVRHGFLKLKGIQWVDEKGELKKGDTFLDPTWNLGAHRFRYKPECFCRSYEEIRKQDIDFDGIDQKCHQIDSELTENTIDLDDTTLRKIFASLGICKKDGSFPILDFIELSDDVDKMNFPEDKIIQAKLNAFAIYYPNFATDLNGSTKVLTSFSLDSQKQNFKKCVVNRVYEKTDKMKRPVLYVYVKLPNAGKKFYIARTSDKKFTEISQKEFEEKFSCYQKDLEKQDGQKPWEEENEKLEDYIKNLQKQAENLETKKEPLVENGGR